MLLMLLWRIDRCSLRRRVEWRRFDFDAAEVQKQMCWMPVRG